MNKYPNRKENHRECRLLPGELASSCQILKNFSCNAMISGCHLDVLKECCAWCRHWWLAIFVQVPSSCTTRIVVGTGTQQAQVVCVLCITHFSTVIYEGLG